jgi:hypothetical protein
MKFWAVTHAATNMAVGVVIPELYDARYISTQPKAHRRFVAVTKSKGSCTKHAAHPGAIVFLSLRKCQHAAVRKSKKI